MPYKDSIDAKLDLVYELKYKIMELKSMGKKINPSFLDAYYVKLIYNNVSIEGNTLTLVEVSDLLEHDITICGKKLKDHVEVLNMREGLEIMETFLHKGYGVTPTLLKTMHKIVTNKVLPKEQCGKYRTQKVYLRTSTYIPPNAENVGVEMTILFEWYKNRIKQGFDKIRTAILFHQKLMHLHPFTDGNGRTGRFLLNYMLLLEGLVPVIIPTEDRGEYFDALEVANWNEENTEDIEEFILTRIIESLENYINAME